MNIDEVKDLTKKFLEGGAEGATELIIKSIPDPESANHSQYEAILPKFIQCFEEAEGETIEELLVLVIQKVMKYYFYNFNTKEFACIFKSLCQSKHIEQILLLIASNLNEYFVDNDIHDINVLVHYQAPIFAELIQNISNDISMKLFIWFDKADQLFPFIFGDSLELLKGYYKLIYHGFFQSFILPIQNPAQGCTPLSEHQREILACLKKKIAQIATELDAAM